MAALLSNPQISGSITCGLGASAANNSTTTNVNATTGRSLVVGSSAGQVNKVVDIALAITTGTPQTIDLTTATDPEGNAVTFTVVYGIKIVNNSVTSGQIITPFGGTNGIFATGTVPLPAGTANNPSSVLYDFGSTGVTLDSTHKIIQLVVAAGSAVPATVTVIGQ